MTSNFNYHKLDKKDKKNFIIHQVILFLIIIFLVTFSINKSDPVIETTSQKISITMGGMFTIGIIVLAVTNRLKKLLQVKFTVFLVLWFILLSLNSIMGTLISGIGIVIIPLAFDDIIMSAYWNKVWYNKYDR